MFQAMLKINEAPSIPSDEIFSFNNKDYELIGDKFSITNRI